MKRTQYDLSRLKHQLFQMRNSGKKNPVWKLTQFQIEFVERLGFHVIPRIYRINTRTFNGIKNRKGIIKEVHYSRTKEHKTVIYKQLSPKQVEVLEEAGVKLCPYKYEIKLR